MSLLIYWSLSFYCSTSSNFFLTFSSAFLYFSLSLFFSLTFSLYFTHSISPSPFSSHSLTISLFLSNSSIQNWQTSLKTGVNLWEFPREGSCKFAIAKEQKSLGKERGRKRAEKELCRCCSLQQKERKREKGRKKAR